MGRKVVFSAIMVAGLVHWTPAFAQQNETQQGAAIAPPAPVAEPKPAAKAAEAAPAAVPAPERVAAEPVAVKMAAVKPREPDLADKDLAAVPPEETPPAIVDPNRARHGLASVMRRAAPPATPVREAPRHEVAVAVAERVPEPAPVRAAAPVPAPVRAPAPARIERVAEARPAPIAEEHAARADLAVAERVVRRAQVEHGDDAALARASRAAPSRPRPLFAEPEEEAALAEAEQRERAVPARAVEEVREAPPVERVAEQVREPVPVERVAEEVRAAAPAERVAEEVRDVAPVRAERVTELPSAPEVDLPAPRPAVSVAARAPRPVYADEPEERVAEQPVYAREERRARDAYPEDAVATADEAVEEPAPVYAEDARDAGPADPPEERVASRGYDDRDGQDDRRTALDDRAVRPVAYPMAQARGMSPDDRACSSSRAAALQQRVRREASRGLIDWQVAQDIDDEIIHADDVRLGYCASGMNDWREERLEQQYAQIEDRIRYEEARGER